MGASGVTRHRGSDWLQTWRRRHKIEGSESRAQNMTQGKCKKYDICNGQNIWHYRQKNVWINFKSSHDTNIASSSPWFIFEGFLASNLDQQQQQQEDRNYWEKQVGPFPFPAIATSGARRETAYSQAGAAQTQRASQKCRNAKNKRVSPFSFHFLVNILVLVPFLSSCSFSSKFFKYNLLRHRTHWSLLANISPELWYSWTRIVVVCSWLASFALCIHPTTTQPPTHSTIRGNAPTRSMCHMYHDHAQKKSERCVRLSG